MAVPKRMLRKRRTSAGERREVCGPKRKATASALTQGRVASRPNRKASPTAGTVSDGTTASKPPSTDATSRASTARPPTRLLILDGGSGASQALDSGTIVFGSVTLAGYRPTSPERAVSNIRQGQLALKRAMPVFGKVGVKLDLPSGVPKFHADSEGRLVQVLNGKSSFVNIVDGQVVPA